jgi:hypothetical protein
MIAMLTNGMHIVSLPVMVCPSTMRDEVQDVRDLLHEVRVQQFLEQHGQTHNNDARVARVA